MADIASEAEVLPSDPFTLAASKLCVYLWREGWSHAPQVLAGDAEALHDQRVALRRLRSTLENCAALAGPGVREDIAAEMLAERRHLRQLGDALGAVRDFDVLEEYLRDYATERDIEIASSKGLLKFGKYLHGRREENFAPMTRRIERAARPRKNREQFARWAHSLAGVAEPNTSLAEAAPQVLSLRVDEALAMGHVLASHDEEEQHELRKNLRRLRYTLEAFEPAFGKTKSLVKSLTAMQDVLGEMQDRTVLRAMLFACFKVDAVKDLPDGAREFAEFGDARREELLQEVRATWAEHEASGFWDTMRAA